MYRNVGGVFELIGDPGVWGFFLKLQGLCYGSFHTQGAVGDHKLSPVSLDGIATFLRHGGGKYDHNLNTQGCTYHGQTDAGIAGGRFNNRGVVVNFTGSKCILDHLKGNAILYRSSRVESLKLGNNLRRGIMFFFYPLEFEKGGGAYKIGNFS